MDNVTHALAGCLLAAATVTLVERRPTAKPPRLRGAATLTGIIAAELPDADLLYAGPMLGMGKLGYLLHHRGHTHTVLFAIAAALLVWGIVLAVRRDLREPRASRAMLGLALAGTLSHIVLDFTNSYGVHPFWPVVNRWFYGDAVFIVEPWFWIVALPPLLLFTRSTAARVVQGVMLVGILAAAWLVSMVGWDVALALTLAAALWFAVLRAAAPGRRIMYAGLAWLMVEGVFFGATSAARAEVHSALSPTVHDVVLTPEVSNPLCFRALVVQTDSALYRAKFMTVAPFTSVRDASGCAAPSSDEGVEAMYTSSRSIRYGREWTAPVGELAALAASNCEIAAALQFIRVPAWRRVEPAGIELSDLRYGEGGGSFATIVAAERPAACPRHVPGWTPPRSDLLGVGQP